MGRTALLGVVVGAVASLAVAAPAFAIEFGAPVTVSPPETVFGDSPAVAVNAAGDVVVAWADVFPGGVYAAYRPRDGSFSAPQRLTARRRVEGTDVGVAVTASGEALVTWTENETLAALGRARARVVVASRPAAGPRFGAPTELSIGQQGAHTPSLASTPGGEVVAVWEELRTLARAATTDPLRISGSVRTAAGAWGAPVALSDTQRRFTSGVSTPQRERMVPQVAVLPNGAALAVWERASGTSTTCCQRIEAAVRPAGGAFGPAETLTEASARDFAVLRDVKGAGSRWGALGWNGSALLLFERPEAGAFAAALAVPGALGEFTEAGLALAPDGAASVVKGVPLAVGAPCESVGGTYALATTSRPAGGVFGPDHLLTPADQPGAHADAAHAGARAIFSWEQPRRSAIEEREPGGCNFLGTKPFGADGAPGADPAPGVRASGMRVDGRSPSLAGDPAGMAVLAWIGGNERVRVARADGGSLGRDRYPDIVAPRLRRVRLQPRSVLPGGRLRLGFRLSERAVVTVRIARRGRRFGSFRGAARARRREDLAAGACPPRRLFRRGPRARPRRQPGLAARARGVQRALSRLSRPCTAGSTRTSRSSVRGWWAAPSRGSSPATTCA